jgi:hypothetical protein
MKSGCFWWRSKKVDIPPPTNYEKSVRISSRRRDTMPVFQTYIHDIRSYESILPKNIDVIRQFSENEKVDMIMELNKIVQYLLSLIDVDRDMENTIPK